ncbi:sodium/calcium exchanger NCL1 [Phoenix dactylifera]|uniref:Sodium/calcium exchanger NCL1 n=1 Tax=Phoenix dactylifera TaxID=42345 RepID=A0A8B9AFE6_PHODC|nr:sodium/calcium exchanger NCL1 [Phoenix dactylifera]
MAKRPDAFPPPLLLLSLLLLLLAGRGAHGRLISTSAAAAADEEEHLISDGVTRDGATRSDPVLLLRRSAGYSRLFSAEECEQTYGFLPCTTTVVGNLFLAVAYGFLMFKGATYLSTGSELLLEILGPGIVGGLFLPILGALPDAMLILVSGLSGSKETAQNQVLIGMGLLAGSTVMLLTLLWGSCVVVGKCDLSENSTSIDLQDTKGFSLFGSGISTDLQTSYAARIMAISIVPFIIVQLPKIFKFPSGQRLAVLFALIASAALVLSYCLYQIFQPWIQRRRLAYAKHKHVISGILRHAQMQSLGRLLDDNGNPDGDVIRKLFHRLDLNSDGIISSKELRALIIGIQFEEIDLDRDDAVEKVMLEFDTSHNAFIEEDEFVEGIKKWINEAKRTIVTTSGAYSQRFLHDFHMKTKEEHNMLIDKSDEAVESIDNPTWTCLKAVLLLLLGTVIAAVFADPLVDAVDNFSLATNIPSFFISFIAMPLATNSSEAVSAIIFASRKKQRTSSLTFSEIYGGVTMNNTLCLAVFLALVYLRHLTWDFSAEVLVILVVCIVMGLFTSFRTKFPLWTCFIAYLLYPLSLVIVYILDFVFGWS